jgi:hypothetical protein
VYVVNVRARDADMEKWTVDRRYNEFYVLESKLIEFHGAQIVGPVPLPAKRIFVVKSE